MPNNDIASGEARNPDQLTGWKDIASYLDKAVRTVQRWELQLGLPVHRIRVQGNETVFAFKSELDSWRASVEQRQLIDTHGGPGAERHLPGDQPDARDSAVAPSAPLPGPASATPRRKARNAIWAVAAILGVVAMLLLGMTSRWGFTSPADANPAEWKVDEDGFHVYNRAGSVLWSKTFDPGLSPPSYESSTDPTWTSPVHIQDIDGDGKPEVLIVTRHAVADPSMALYCFESDGVERWVHRITRSVSYGSHGTVLPLRPHNPPFMTMNVWVLNVGARTPEVWAAARHHQEFPTVLQRLDPAGRVIQEYWSNGDISTLTSGVVGGERRYFVGGVKNEDEQASFAVFDSKGPRGVAPAQDPYYACQDCGADQPLMAFAFPRTEVSRFYGGYPAVEVVAVRENDVWVTVRHNVGREGENQMPFLSAGATYHFDSRLRLIEAELQTQYEAFHRRLEQAGLFDHPYDRAHEHELWPVGRWDGQRWEQMPGPQVPDR